MASRKTSPPKPAKAVVKLKRTRDEVINDLRTSIKDLRTIDPEHPWARLLKDALAAIRDDYRTYFSLIKGVHIEFTVHAREFREGMVQARGELEQVKAHLVRFLHEGRNDRGWNERIEAQLAGINERLKERSRDGRVVRHGKTTTAEELSRQLDAMERAKGEEVATLRDEVKRVRSELEATRATVLDLETMAADRRKTPPPRRSWRTTAAEKEAAAPID